MNLSMNNKEVSPLTLVKTVYASVLEDIYYNFEDYAKVFIKNYNDYNTEELDVINKKKSDLYNKINNFLGKHKLI